MAAAEEMEWWNNNAEFGLGAEEPAVEEPAVEEPDAEEPDADELDFFPHDVPVPQEAVQEEPVPHHLVVVAERLRLIGDEIEGKYNSLSGMLQTNPEAERPDRLVNIIRLITDVYPRMCWQQIGLFMYAGARFVSRLMDRITWTEMVAERLVEQMRRYLAQRILGLGGWRGIGAYLRTTTGRAWLVFAAGVASAILVYKGHTDRPSARDVGGLIRDSLYMCLRLLN